MLNQPKDNLPDRPLECSECKKPLAVRYTEIVGSQMNEIMMCADCPELKRRLQGTSTAGDKASEEGKTGLACGDCGTTLASIQVGNPLGCSHCYEVFDAVILTELQTADKIPQRISSPRKSIPIHVGRAPGESIEISPTLKLLALNEALDETLKREDYEQAAQLRDQINALQENTDEEDGKKK